MKTVVGGYFRQATWSKIALKGEYEENAPLFYGVTPNCSVQPPLFWFQNLSN
jgi:hypothetical protein